ncbi:hypothetical protein OG21DRAFT_488248 [Imleria badia]|nr:hypothetical protein OG21DRAFT_488248 [Imleria badia]
MITVGLTFVHTILLVLNHRCGFVTETPVLTLSREIDTVWCRPWTWISTLFVIVCPWPHGVWLHIFHTEHY